MLGTRPGPLQLPSWYPVLPGQKPQARLARLGTPPSPRVLLQSLTIWSAPIMVSITGKGQTLTLLPGPPHHKREPNVVPAQDSNSTGTPGPEQSC